MNVSRNILWQQRAHCLRQALFQPSRMTMMLVGETQETLYGHGMVWNRELAGVAGAVKLSFDLRVNLQTGTGFGTADDPVHSDWNIHFAINSAKQEKVRRGETRYTLVGVVTHANNPDNVGEAGQNPCGNQWGHDRNCDCDRRVAFAGAGLVVIAIIAVLMALLLPAVQKADRVRRRFAR